ncbi:MAG: hypothetical protein GX910_00510 [Clostridiaceae bacterium]|jgi:hypothetical protein|nr:hypothetical protein [Clostridiaceae bacterium]
MLLLDVRKEDGWLLSTFNLTFPVGWDRICKAVSMVFDYYEDAEILIDGKKAEILSKDDILGFEEAGSMTVRGMSIIIKAPITITFYNQLQVVNVAVASMTDEFKEADYQEFNMSLGQYMDSLELAMYR